jgi:hypothetical protein
MQTYRPAKQAAFIITQYSSIFLFLQAIYPVAYSRNNQVITTTTSTSTSTTTIFIVSLEAAGAASPPAASGAFP